MFYEIVDYLRYLEISHPPNLLYIYNRRKVKLLEYF